MKVIWSQVHKKCNITDSNFEEIVEKSDTTLTQDDKDFILTSYNAGMYNYVVEYVFNKSIKILQDVVFSIGEDIVIGITHWIDRSFISKFFDVFILRLATDFDLISRQEKLKILQTIELLQKRKDDHSNTVEIDKEKAKYLILNLFDAILTKDYTPFTTSIRETLEVLYNEEIVPYSDLYNDVIESTNKHKNLLIRIMFAMLRDKTLDGKKFKVLSQNVKNLFPFLWDTASMNDKKFIAYYLKVLPPDSPINKLFLEISTQIKMQDFNTDLGVITKILRNCQDVLSSHYSVNNHKGEITPLSYLAEIDHIPNLFLRSVVTPAIVCFLGNNFGYLSESRISAEKIFANLTSEKWTYYFKNYFYRDDFVLITLLTNDNCLKDWCNLVKKSGVALDDFSNENIKELLIASKEQNFEKVKEYANKIYYS